MQKSLIFTILIKSINGAITPLLTNISTRRKFFRLARINDRSPCYKTTKQTPQRHFMIKQLIKDRAFVISVNNHPRRCL